MPKLRPKLYPKVALATTTIRVPRVLELLRAHDPDVAFFIAGDEKTPAPACSDFVRTLGSDALYYSPNEQKALGYACSELIPWNCIQRRNIAMLEALKWGAEIIVLWDDDNLPLNESYFDDFISYLSHSFDGLKAVSNDWVDPGQLLEGHPPHRGIPYGITSEASIFTTIGAKVGVAAGLCLGDPDISATTRLEHSPVVHRVSQLADAGVVVDPEYSWTVFNSQNTAIIRELVPAMLLVPQFKRFDDIFASLVTQRIMRERGYHVHFGRPYIWQSRNPHSLLKDLDDELWGMQHIVQFTDWLDSLKFQAGAPVLDAVRQTYARINELPWMPEGVTALGKAWCDDVAKVLA